MLIETQDPVRSKGTLSQHSPKSRNIIYAQPEKKQAKEPCIIGGESEHQVFYTAIQGKLNKDNEGGNSQPSKHQKRTTLSFVSFFLFYI